MDLDSLQQKFGSDTVKFVKGPEEFVSIEIANAKAKAKICTYGAHIMEFTPAGQLPLLWMSKSSWFEAGKPIRGGVPLCWPWFGAGASPELPAHGFARLSQWQVAGVEALECGATRVTLTLSGKDVANQSLVKFPFELQMEFTVGSRLQLKLTMRNLSDKPQVVTDALHTYFSVSDAEKIAIRGLDLVGYEDRVVGAPVVYGNVQTGELRIDAEVDRIYLDTMSAVEIVDPGFNRTIRVEKEGSASTVVWNPWFRKSHAMPDFGDDEFHGMVCIEAVNASIDARTIEPGDTHVLAQTITIL